MKHAVTRPLRLGDILHDKLADKSIPSDEHNSRLKQALATIEQHIKHAKSDDDLVAAINLLTPFPVPVQYDNRRLNLITALFCAASAITAVILLLIEVETDYLLAPSAAMIITLVTYAGMRLHRKTGLSKLSRKIEYLTGLFDYGLQHIAINSKGKAREYGNRFRAFQLGDYSREIRSLLRGSYDGTDHSFSYEYYHFHYVNQRIETYTTTDSKGNVRVRTRTVYDHFDRYGFIVPFKFAKQLRISEGRLGFFSPKWKSSSVSFNKNFNVETANEFEAAKFLTPKILVEIESAGAALRGLDMEFNSLGELCFSFDNSNTLASQNAGSLANPAAFAKHISGHNVRANLDAALAFIHTLLKYSDNNFEQKQGG